MIFYFSHKMMFLSISSLEMISLAREHKTRQIPISCNILVQPTRIRGKSNLTIDCMGIIGKLLTITKDLDSSTSLDDRHSTEFQGHRFRFDHSGEGMSESDIESAPQIQFIRRQFVLWGSNNKDRQDELGLA
jgi:hypothetical protein